jgi:hypothetical protein
MEKDAVNKKKEEEAVKRVKQGWIRVGMMIEALAISKETAESAIAKHVEKMERENGIMIYKKDFRGSQEVKRPLPNIEKGYSQVIDLEMVAENFDRLVYMVMNYGPSAIEIIEPKNIVIDFGEAQGILNSLASLIHTYAAMGVGGMVVST